ncbi:MAG: NAD-binding protein [Syntrophomonadaceae bacterium]
MSELKGKLITLVVAVLGIIFVCTIGLHFLEDWSWFTSLWIAVSSLTTTGYGELVPSTVGGKAFMMIMLVLGLGLVLYALSTIFSILVEHQIRRLAGRDIMMEAIKRMEKHVIVCGAGRVGINAALLLRSYNVPYVLIDKQEVLINDAAEDGHCVMLGDATRDEILIKAGIMRAQGIICAMSEDAHNVFGVLTARSLNPKLKIVARSTEPQTVAKLHQAGADKVISPTQSGGHQMAMAMIKPAAVEMVNTLFLSKHLEIQLEEVEISEYSLLANRPINTAFDREKNNVVIVAIIRNEEVIMNPRGKDVILPGDTLVLIGSRHDLEVIDSKFDNAS